LEATESGLTENLCVPCVRRWGETDKYGIPVWKPESSNYYPLVQDPRGFYGPVDPNFGKIITEPDHQRLNNHYVHQMLMAGKLRKGGNKKDFKSPFLGSLYRTLRFHLGSVCVGAFIIALVQLIRAILLYIDKQVRSTLNVFLCLPVEVLWSQCFRTLLCVTDENLAKSEQMLSVHVQSDSLLDVLLGKVHEIHFKERVRTARVSAVHCFNSKCCLCMVWVVGTS